MSAKHSTQLGQCTAPAHVELIRGAHLRCLPLRGLGSRLCGLCSGLRRRQGLHALHGWRRRRCADWPRLLLLWLQLLLRARRLLLLGLLLQLLLGLGLQLLLWLLLLLLWLLWLLWLLCSTDGLSRRLPRPRCWRLHWLALHGAAASLLRQPICSAPDLCLKHAQERRRMACIVLCECNAALAHVPWVTAATELCWWLRTVTWSNPQHIHI